MSLTIEEYNALSPYDQGYKSYEYRDWPDTPVPIMNPYAVTSSESIEWDRGYNQAVADTTKGQ